MASDGVVMGAMEYEVATPSASENFVAESVASVSPTLTSDVVTVSAQEECDVRVVDVYGNEVYHSNSAAKVHEISLLTNPQGLYLVEIETESGKTQLQKIVKK